jgi:hypothetical protein
MLERNSPAVVFCLGYSSFRLRVAKAPAVLEDMLSQRSEPGRR